MSAVASEFGSAPKNQPKKNITIIPDFLHHIRVEGLIKPRVSKLWYVTRYFYHIYYYGGVYPTLSEGAFEAFVEALPCLTDSAIDYSASDEYDYDTKPKFSVSEPEDHCTIFDLLAPMVIERREEDAAGKSQPLGAIVKQYYAFIVRGIQQQLIKEFKFPEKIGGNIADWNPCLNHAIQKFALRSTDNRRSLFKISGKKYEDRVDTTAARQELLKEIIEEPTRQLRQAAMLRAEKAKKEKSTTKSTLLLQPQPTTAAVASTTSALELHRNKTIAHSNRTGAFTPVKRTDTLSSKTKLG